MCLCDRGNDFVSVTTIYYLKFENYSDGSSLPPPPSHTHTQLVVGGKHMSIYAVFVCT